MSHFSRPRGPETIEIETLRAMGFTDHQARAFTQWLDDERPCGISATLLLARVRDLLDRQERENRFQIDQLSVMVDSLRGPPNCAMLFGK